MIPDSQLLYRMFADVFYPTEYLTTNPNEVHVTEATQCLLKSFLQRIKGRKLLDAKVVILSFGRITHKALQEQLIKHGYTVEVEKRYEFNNTTLLSHVDALAEDHILEIKTISRIPKEPLPHHYLQANAYSFIYDKPISYIAYIHKPSGICTILPCPKDLTRFEYVCYRAVRLAYYTRTNTMPTPDPSWLCRYCEYTDLCPKTQQTHSNKGGF